MTNAWTLRNKLIFTFGAILATTSALITFAISNENKLTETVRWNTHTYEVLQQSESMLLNMVNIETGLRGFVAGGSENFLEPFNKGKDAFIVAFDKAKKLTSDNAEQQSRLDKILDRHKRFMDVGNALVTTRRDATAGKISMEDLLKEFSSGKDKAEMDPFRGLIADFSKAEEDLLVIRSRALADISRLNELVLFFGGLGLVLLSAALGFALLRSVMRQIGGEPADAMKAFAAVAKGELTVRIPVAHGDTSSLMAGLAIMRDELSKVVGTVRLGAEALATSSAEIAQGNDDLSARTEQQASSLEETAASMEELSSTVKQNADSARAANQLAAKASTVAIQGGEVVGQVVQTMKGINDSSRKISDIISVIDGIAFQTNILALNAAVEAARAGEQGRGFAVVASEVRSLAGRSAEAAKEIKSLISASVERVEQGTALVDKAGETMTEVVGSIRRVTDLMGEISAASNEQAAGVAQVGEAVSQMDKATQQNAALVEEMAAAAASVRSQAGDLVQTVAFFQLDTNHPVARATVRSPIAQSKPFAGDDRRTLTSTSPKPRPAATAAKLPPVKTAPKPAPVAAASSNSAGGDDSWETF